MAALSRARKDRADAVVAEAAPAGRAAAGARSDIPLGTGPLAEAWFAARGWQPFAFQREVWGAMAAGQSGLLHATTGSGKTYAVWFGALARRHRPGRARARPSAPPLASSG